MILSPAPARTRIFATVCLVGAVLNFVAYYPGFLTSDGFDQFGQSLAGSYKDWHPPMMAVWWRILNNIHRGPQVMLLFQVVCLWCSGYFLALSFEFKLWKWLVLLLVVAPFVQNFAGYIVKDSQMALSWLLAFSLMLFCLQKQTARPTTAILSALLLFYGLSVRPNAIPGCIPLSIFWVSVFAPPAMKKASYRYGLLFVSFLFGLQMLVTVFFIRPSPTHSENKLFLHDMVAIYVKTGDSKIFPTVLYSYPGFDTAYMRGHYHPATFDMVWWNSDGIALSEASNGHTAAAIRKYWWDAVTRHPFEYIQHRTSGFLYYLRLRDRGAPLYNYFFQETENKYEIQHEPTLLSRLFSKPAVVFGKLPFMQPWFWFFLNILMVFFARAIEDRLIRNAYNTLVWSGLLYQLPSILIYQVDTDFRYFYWNCIAQFLAVSLFVIDRIGRKSSLPSAT